MLYTRNSKLYSNLTFLTLGAFALMLLIMMNYTVLQLGGGGLGMAFNNGTWLAYLGIIFAGVLTLCFKGRIVLSKSALYYSLCIVILLALPILLATEAYKYEAVLTSLAIAGAFFLFIIVEQFRTTKFSNYLLILIFLSTLIQSIWGLVQYYFIYESNVLFFNAESTHPHGTFGQKNVFASYLSLGSLLAIYFLFNSKIKTRVHVAFTFIVVFINAHLTMLAEAETGRVVPIIAIIIYLSYCAFKYGSRKVVLGLVLTCCVASFTPKQWFNVRPNQVIEAPIRIDSFGVRPIMYQIGMDIVIDNPWTGIGRGNLPREFNLRKVQLEKQNGLAPIEMDITNHIHNEPLQWMIEFGILSGIAFLGFFLTWVFGLLKGWIDPSILLLALPMVGHAMLELPFYASAPHMLVFVTILALASKGTKKIIRFPKALSAVVLPLTALFSYKVVAFLLLSLASMKAIVDYRLGNEQDESLLYSVEPTPSFERFFTHEKYEWNVKRSMQQGSISKELVFSFIDFLEENRMKWPEALLYIQLAEMYQISRQPQKAEEIMEEAKAFFPWDERIIAYFEKK